MKTKTAVLGGILLGVLAGAGTARATIRPEEAIAAALSEVTATEDGLRVRHPLHTVSFERDGVTFTPARGGPDWRWRLVAVRSGGESAPFVEPGPVDPANDAPRRVTYVRGAIEEQYLLGDDHVEQRFVLLQPLADGAADLAIEGAVETVGTLERGPDGWVWRAEDGVVSLGDVTVRDAGGHEIPASMSVTADGTRIVIDGPALALAEFPVTVDPEIGTNDFRLSDMGDDGDITFDGELAAIAWDSVRDQYLVVWEGDDDAAGLGDGQFEIFGQRIDGASGAEIGANDFRISDMGIDGDGAADAVSPAVAFNATNGEFLVVWSGDDGTGGLANGEFEIFAQRIDAATGAEVGTNDFRISDMGTDGDPLADAIEPAVAWDATRNEYLVVWEGDDLGVQADDETEIYGQRLAGATGAEIGTNDFRLSDMGPDLDPLFDARSPAVAWSAAQDEYLVVWEGDDTSTADGEFEIFGQRVSGAGAEVGTNDFRISDMGPNGDPTFDANAPAVAWGSSGNTWLVVWEGDDDLNGLVVDEREIFGQRIAAATGAAVGTNDFRISTMGPNADPRYDAFQPAVTYSPLMDEFFVVWRGDTKSNGNGDDEFEVFGQRLQASSGAEIGTNDLQLTRFGASGDPEAGGFAPAVAYDVTDAQYLVVCHGDQNAAPLANDEFEVWGQRVSATSGTEIGLDDFRISDMGPDGDIDWDARAPMVAYDPDLDEYLVVWRGDDNVGTLVAGENEIFGQRIDGVTGAEIGANDFRISHMGSDGDIAFDADDPAVVYNGTAREYLVVWSGEDDTAPLVQGEFEIWGQRIDAATGLSVGAAFRISDMGPDGDPLYDASHPRVAYNPGADEYLVVWQGDDNVGTLVEGEIEVFGQRLSGATGAEIGANDFRISDMSVDGDVNFDAAVPVVAYDPAHGQYLVAWAGEDGAGAMVVGEFEIFGQLLDAAGAQIGTNDFRISDMGPDGDDLYDAFAPSVAFNPSAGEYLVVWQGSDNSGLLSSGEEEIFGQRIVAATGAEIGTNDFRISDMGPDGDNFFDATAPAVAYDAADGEYLVVWEGDDDTAPLVDGEQEIFGQRLDGATCVEVGDNDFRLSDMGPDGDGTWDALQPVLALNGASDRYLVVWRGDDGAGLLQNDEFEVYVQQFTTQAGATGVAVAPASAPAPGGIAITSLGPNPTRSRVRLSLAVPGGGAVELTVFDVRGRVVGRQAVRTSGQGTIEADLDLSRLAGGVYLVRAASGRQSAARKITVAR